MTLEQFAEIASETLRGVFRPDDFDVTTGEHPLLGLTAEDADISTDGWTIRCEQWPHGPIWLAIDDEPPAGSAPSLYRDELRALMPAKVLRALQTLDLRLDGALIAGLARSGDPLTAALLELMSPDIAQPS